MKITHEKLREELESGKTIREISKEYGISERAIYKRKARLKATGYDPENERHYKNPEDQAVKGYSTLVRHKNKDDESAGTVMEWVKTDVEKHKQAQAMSAAIDQLCEQIPARIRIKRPPEAPESLANMITFSDYHHAMQSWSKEGGADWNRDIAKQTLKASMTDQLRRAPAAKTCIINQLGDWSHSDGMTPTTPTSGHLLDQDGTPAQMIDLSIECMDYLITEALRTHERVIVVIAQGNHDLYSALWLRKMFVRLYRDEPRVEFVENELPFYAFKFGKSVIGFHHGHKVKFDRLPALFADEFRHLMGDTVRTYIHMGHYHHKEIKEVGKAVVEMHRTLAARDSHASYGGYHSQRSTDLITYHKEYGEVGRITSSFDMLV